MVDHAKHEKNLGWEFVYDKDHIDPVLGIQFLSEAYYKADDDYTGRTTVPALIDTKTGKVVNNDYTWLTNYFEVDFKPFHKKGAPDLYPEELRKDIDEMNDWLFDNINNGVYKATFARSKEAYWDAYNSFYAVLRCPDYVSPVTYWMAFYGVIGMHDLTSRKAFGGDIYKTRGSHGCINMSYSDAGKLYELIQVGDPVIMHY